MTEEYYMINLLKFNKKYYKAIADGRKTQTLRNKNKRLETGETVKAIFPGTDLECIIQITDTGYKQFKYLNDDDAKLEGYDSLEDLKKDLQEIYPLMMWSDRLWYYRFKIVDTNVQ